MASSPGALGLITLAAIAVLTKLAGRLGDRTIVRSTIGGVVFGLLGVMLPLTLFTGTDQLTTVIDDGSTLGAGLLIGLVFAKILAFAVCEATGFIGGPFLVMLFIGGTAGTAAHVLIPGLPEGLAFTAMFAALPGSLVAAAPFSLILLGAFTTQIGTLQMVPVTIAVLTAYLAVSGSGEPWPWLASGPSLRARRRRDGHWATRAEISVSDRDPRALNEVGRWVGSFETNTARTVTVEPHDRTVPR